MNNLTVQDIQFLLMEKVSADHVIGKEIVRSLKAHKDLWRAAIMVRDSSSSNHLITLGDVEENQWHADTLCLLPVDGKEDVLFYFAHTLVADEIDWVNNERASRMMGITDIGEKRLLRVWWD